MPKFRDLMAASAIVAIAFNSVEASASTPKSALKELQSRPPQSDSWQTIAETPDPSSTLPEAETVADSPTEAILQRNRYVHPTGYANAIETTAPTDAAPLPSPDDSTDPPILPAPEPETAASANITDNATLTLTFLKNSTETPISTPTELNSSESETAETPEIKNDAALPSWEGSAETPVSPPNVTESETAALSPEPVPVEVAAPTLPDSLVQAQQNSPDTLTENTAQIPLNPETDPTPPERIEPSPNPLLFPTRPSEVEIQNEVPITLEQAVEHAWKNNLELQRSILELERSREAIREARAAFFPTVDAQAAYTRTDSAAQNLNEEATNRQREEAGLPPVDISSVSNTLTGQIQLGYDIYTSGERSARLKIAEHQARIDELDVERISEEVRLDVSTAYYNLQEADENVRINEAAVRNAEKSLEDARALERAGVGTQFDVLRAEVNLANAQQDLSSSLGDQRTTRRQLAQLLNISQTANLLAADDVKIAGLWEPSLEQTIVLALKNRAELEQLLVQRDVSEQQRRLALSQIGPQVRVTANYNVLEDLDDSLGFASGSSIQLLASWRLFDGGAARSAARQQEINGEIAANQFADLRNQFRFQVEQFYSELEANLESIQTAQKALEQAQEALELARLRFQAGVGTQTEVIDSETDLTRAEGNLVTAILGYNRSLVGLQRAVSNFPLTDPVLE
ncbi:MAG TPA: TolC family protein [Oscillatoriales cyanobacterium M59_W2019_021]|nr:TolC family protein [Oscillatoriales cyanobacterium M59_W2019_021]